MRWTAERFWRPGLFSRPSKRGEDHRSSRLAGLSGGVSRAFKNGIFVSVSASVQSQRYRAKDPLFGVKREDTAARLSVKVVNRSLKYAGFAPYAGYSYEKNDSNISLYEYENHGLLMGLFPGLLKRFAARERWPSPQAESTLLLVRNRARRHRFASSSVDPISSIKYECDDDGLETEHSDLQKKVVVPERRLPGGFRRSYRRWCFRAHRGFLRGYTVDERKRPPSIPQPMTQRAAPSSPLPVSRRGRRWYLMCRR